MNQKEKEKGRLYKMYGNFVQVPYVWYQLCRKYEIPKEVAVLKTKGNTVDLNPMEINVLAYLAGYEDCHPSNKQIAATFQVGVSTIEKYLKELRWVGFIKTFEDKKEPTHTDKRNIFVQFDTINAVLKSKSNPYKCMVPSECNPYEHMAKPIQTNGTTHTDVGIDPYMLATNKKELESIRKNNKEVANAPNTSDEVSEINFNSKCALSNERVKFAVDKMIAEINVDGHSYESMIDYLVKEFTGAFYQCDKEAIITYANNKLTS